MKGILSVFAYCRIKICSCFFLFFLLWVRTGFAQPGTITTYAGPALPVNGAPATTQVFDDINSVAADGTGGFYLLSSIQNRVYGVDSDGRLRLVAGVGVNGFSGDGGSATAAQLNYPADIAVDSGGNLYIADLENHRIRKVTPAGIISTVASGLFLPWNVAVDSVGNLYVAEPAYHHIRKVTPAGVMSTVAGNGTSGFSGDGGPATGAQFRNPRGVAVDAKGNLYIADSGNNRVRRVTPEGVISTVAGGGTSLGDGGPATSASLLVPYGVAIDETGNLHVGTVGSNPFDGSLGHHRVRKVSLDGIISTVAGNGIYGFSGDGGAATSAQLANPRAVSVDAGGNLFIADSSNDRIRKVTPGGFIRTVAGSRSWGFSGDGGPATSARLSNPKGPAIDAAGNLYFADSGNNHIRKITPAGIIHNFAGSGIYGFSGDGGPATSASMRSPADVAVDVAGNVYFVDSSNNRVRKVTPGGIISTVAGTGAFGFSGDGGPAISAQLNYPGGLGVDASGNLYISDAGNYRIRKVTPAGAISTVAGNGTSGFSGDGGPATSAQLGEVSDVAVDRSGSLYIADSGNNRIRKVTPGGIISTVAGTGFTGFTGDGGPATSAQLRPRGLAVDAAGNLFFESDERICQVTPAGVIGVVAGSGQQGFSGDGGPARTAQLFLPNGVAVDSAGNLYIADSGNDRIRRVAGPTGLTSLFPHIAVGGGFSTKFIFGNTGSSTVSGVLTLTDQQGRTFFVMGELTDPIGGTQTKFASLFAISIPPGGVRFLSVTSASLEGSVEVGWAQMMSTGGSLYGVAVFQHAFSGSVQSTAGVLQSQPTQFATIPVDDDVSENRFTGYSVSNPSSSSITVKVVQVGSDGNIVTTLNSIELAPWQQKAVFLFQDPKAEQKFQGSVVLTGEAGAMFCAVALVQVESSTGPLYTVIPVLVSKAPNIN